MILNILLILIILILIYVIINLRRKVIILEKSLSKHSEDTLKIYNNILTTIKHLEIIDKMDMFEKDDDVGIAFRRIKEIFKTLQKSFNENKDKNASNKKEN